MIGGVALRVTSPVLVGRVAEAAQLWSAAAWTWARGGRLRADGGGAAPARRAAGAGGAGAGACRRASRAGPAGARAGRARRVSILTRRIGRGRGHGRARAGPAI